MRQICNKNSCKKTLVSAAFPWISPLWGRSCHGRSTTDGSCHVQHAGCQGVRLSWCQGVRLSGCLTGMVSWCHMSGCQTVMVSECQTVMVSGCQGVRVSGCQVVRLSGCHAYSYRNSQGAYAYATSCD